MAKDEVFAQIEAYCKKYGEQLDKVETGLEYFALHLIAQEKDFTEYLIGGDDPEEVDLSEYRCAGSNDLKIDGLLYSEDLKSVAVIQAAHRSKYSTDIDDKASGFFNSLENWIEADVVHSGNQRVQELIIDSGLNPADQYVALYFFTTLPIGSESGSKLITIANNAQKKYQEKGWNVECKVLGLAEIQDKYIELKNIRDYGLAGPVTFKIQKDFFFEIKDPLKVLVCGIRAGTIADIYNQKEVKNKLFNQNIRLPLSSSKINTAISQTATDSEASKNFFYYNNGITATCSSYEMVDNEITVSDFQVVNGAQTVSALARSVGSGSAVKKSTNAIVLFRLIQTGEQISRKSELADNITRYQNTQNVVRESDFFSNELFQLWLTKNLPEQLSNKGIIPGFYYQHKRGYKPNSRTGEAITIEKLAQLRHSIYYGPAISYNSPRLFWDSNEPHYWQAFGSKGLACTIWNQDEMSEIGWAISVNITIAKIAKELKSKSRKEGMKSDEATYLAYLSRYVTSVVFKIIATLIEQNHCPKFSELIANKTTYNIYCEPIITEVRKLLIADMKNVYGLQGNSRLAFARDIPKFNELVQNVLTMVQSGLIVFNKPGSN